MRASASKASRTSAKGGRLLLNVGLCLAISAGTGACVASTTPAPKPLNLYQAAKAEGEVVIYSVMSNNAAQPLVDDFQSAYPGITVSYDGEKGSTETDARYRSESAALSPTADVLWSSAMDLQIKLVEDGYAATYISPEAANLPNWARYRDSAYGTTQEPVVFVYNKNLLAEAEVPRTHAEFAALLNTQAERFAGRVTMFDIAASGVGYQFAVQDGRTNPNLNSLLEAMGNADIHESSGTGVMLRGINSGEFILGYNVMGAYALSRSKKDLPNLGVVFPTDYTLVLSRVAFVSKNAAHPNAARLWLDYLLSARGQAVLGNAMQIYPARTDIGADFSQSRLEAAIGANVRPIPLDRTLVDDLEPARQAAFLEEWRSAIAQGRRNKSTPTD